MKAHTETPHSDAVHASESETGQVNKTSRHYPQQVKQVYLLGTCLVDSFYPDAGMDAIHILKSCGVEVIYPQSQTCCGQPAYNSGFDDEAREVARRQLQAFAADIPVVVMMGSCAGMLHKDYPHLFRNQPEETQAKALAARTFEFSEFLVNVLNFPATAQQAETADKAPITLALHTSCSARRTMGVAEQHKALMESLPGVTVVEPERVTECCGFGGTFAVKQGDISAAMAADKAQAIAATGCDVLASADCGCLMNISGTLQQQGKPTEAKHLATVIRERLSLGGQ